jgi:hypothetical protein
MTFHSRATLCKAMKTLSGIVRKRTARRTCARAMSIVGSLVAGAVMAFADVLEGPGALGRRVDGPSTAAKTGSSSSRRDQISL